MRDAPETGSRVGEIIYDHIDKIGKMMREPTEIVTYFSIALRESNDNQISLVQDAHGAGIGIVLTVQTLDVAVLF